MILGDEELTSCVWLLGTAGAAADAGELKRLLPDSMGKTPGVVDEVTEPIDEPMKEGISPAAGEKVFVQDNHDFSTWSIHGVGGWRNDAVKGCNPRSKNRIASFWFLWGLRSAARL